MNPMQGEDTEAAYWSLVMVIAIPALTVYYDLKWLGITLVGLGLIAAYLLSHHAYERVSQSPYSD